MRLTEIAKEDPASGVQEIRLRLTRRLRERCERYDPARERWAKASRCGADNSPFFPVWYASIAAIAFRFGVKETLIAASLYSLGYLGFARSRLQRTRGG